MMTQEEMFQLSIKGLIVNPDGNILLLQALKKGVKSWDLPGGRLQQGETPETTLKREIYEETGLKNFYSIEFITMELTKFRTPLPLGEVGIIFSIYRCNLAEHAPVVLSDEHSEFHWVDTATAAALLQPTHPQQLIEILMEWSSLESRSR